MYSLLQLLLFFKNARIRSETGLKKRYPRVIQLPITYKCNSKCVMCNIWKMDSDNEMDIDSFKRVMKSELFKKVKAVGINGGEPSLIKNLPDYADAILSLPKIKALNIISHGFNQKILLTELAEIYEKCKKVNVSFHVSISLDGVGDVHNKIRGLDVYKITASTIDEINHNKHKYCDSFDVGCTVIKQNIDFLSELKVYAKNKKIDLRFRLGINNKRIESHKLSNNFSIQKSEKVHSAKEFFYSLIGNEKTIHGKFKYYSIFRFLDNNFHKRLMGCMWKDSGVTLDSKGNLFYCAVESKKIGNLLDDDGPTSFFSKENLQYRKSIIDTKCDTCIHDYAGSPVYKNISPFIKELFYRNSFARVYKFLSKVS